MNKFILSFFFCLALVVVAKAETTEEKFASARTLLKKYYQADHDSLHKYASLALEYARELEWEDSVIVALRNLSNAELEMGLYKDAQLHSSQGLKMVLGKNDLKHVMFFINVRASSLNYQGKRVDALHDYFEGVKILAKFDISDEERSHLEVAFFNNIATVYSEQERWDEAESYFQKVLDLAEVHHSDYEKCLALNNLADLYVRQGIYETAEGYLHAAMITDPTTDMRLTINIHISLAELYEMEERYGEAFENAVTAYRMAAQLKIPEEITYCENLIKRIIEDERLEFVQFASVDGKDKKINLALRNVGEEVEASSADYDWLTIGLGAISLILLLLLIKEKQKA